MQTLKELLTLAAFRAWLVQQDQTKSYNYCSPNRCLLATYLKDKGYPEASVTPEWARANITSEQYEYPPLLNVIAGGHADPREWTYAHALGRAKAIGD